MKLKIKKIIKYLFYHHSYLKGFPLVKNNAANKQPKLQIPLKPKTSTVKYLSL